MPFSLPITDPVIILLVATAIFLVVPLAFERMRIPGIIGLIVAGAVVGPHGIGLLDRDPTIVLLGTVGLLYLVFVAGLELDLNLFQEYRQRSIVFGLISFALPLALALTFMPMLGFSWPAAWLMGSIIGSHTLLAYPVVSRLGLVKHAPVITVVGGTLVTDTLALTVLAVVAGSLEGDLGTAFWVRLFGILAAYVALMVWGIPRLGRWFFRYLPGQSTTEFIFLLVVLFGSAWLASLAGAQPIIGAFLAGLLLNRLIPNNSPLMVRVRFVGNSLFIPFFLLSVGMLVDPRVLVSSLEVWVIASTIIVLVHLGKYAAAWISQRIFGYDRDERILMFGLSVPQAAATLAVTFVGLEIGLFGEAVVNGVIVMILVTGLVGPMLVEAAGRRVALREEQKPYDPRAAPERILVPVAHPATAEALLDLALALRGRDSDEPIYPLTVVRSDAGDPAEMVAEAEKLLSHSVMYTTAADVPAVPLTRLDANYATGILRGVAETRSSTVIIGWDGRSSVRASIFGSVLDQLLAHSNQLVMVAKLGHPLNTTKRFVVVCPPGIDHHPGIYHAMSAVKRIAGELEAALQFYVVQEDLGPYEKMNGAIRPRLPASFAHVSSWAALLSRLEADLRPDDLVVVLSARQGGIGWHRALERLPGRLADLVPESFIMLYPSEKEATTHAADNGGHARQSRVFPDQVLFDLEARSGREAVETLLRTGLPERQASSRQLAQLLKRIAISPPPEIATGVVVPHVRVDWLSEPRLLLGVAPSGIAFPGLAEPARLIFVLVSPSARPGDHLRLLAWIARVVSNADRLDDLIRCRSVDELERVLGGEAIVAD
jgi:Kef-type K+ transport system membrane component KefB/mannitol/fructose-specific phosphotransferase system IIA component (Ntr-type)/nucleotide-binding universal stress UspA family protein